MFIEWKGMLIVLAVIFIVMLIIKIADSEVHFHPEIKRKMFHIAMGLTMLTLPYLFKTTLSVGVLAIIALAIMYVLKNTRLKDSIGNVLYGVERNSLGEVFFIISVFALFYLSKGDKILYSIPILILTFADSAAAIIGTRYSKKSLAQYFEDPKSIEGSFAFFVVAFIVTLSSLLLFTEVGREETLLVSFILGLTVSLIEMISHTGNDNLLIPLTTFAFLNTLIKLDVETLRINLLIIILIYIIVKIATNVKVFSKLALVEAIMVGYLTIVLYGPYALIPPTLLLLTVMRFPKLKKIEKKNLYDARIIESNVIVGIAICGIVAITGLKQEFYMIYASCYSMHLIVNTFVRLKYYVKYSQIDSFLIAISKGIGFVFIPSLITQQLVFNKITSPLLIVSMTLTQVISAIMIYFKKKNVKKEVTSISNSFMQMRIVLMMTIVNVIMQNIALV